MTDNDKNLDVRVEAKEDYRKRIEEAKRKNRELDRRLKSGSKTEVNSTKGLELHKNHDSIYTMGNSEATILYIIVMLGAIIFKDRWLIWIAATFVYYWHMTRHSRR